MCRGALGLGRADLRVQPTALREGVQLAFHLSQRVIAPADQHHYGKLSAEVDHAGVLDVPAALEDELRDFVDEPGTIGADGGEDGVHWGEYKASTKSEARSTKQIPSTKEKAPNAEPFRLLFPLFEFEVCFVLRASDFVLLTFYLTNNHTRSHTPTTPVVERVARWLKPPGFPKRNGM